MKKEVSAPEKIRKETFGKITIKPEQAGQRLDVFLAANFAQTRSQWQKIIKAGRIKVNQAGVSNHYALKVGDVVSQSKAVAGKTDIKLLAKIKVVAETADYVVINKPAGLVVHPTATSTKTTLVDWLKARYPFLNQVGDNPLRPGLVHRLDKNVSGLLVVAKTQSSFVSLKKQFQTRRILKEYQALVFGQFSQTEGVIDFPIERGSSGRMAARPQRQAGKAAITEFAVIQQYINYTFLKLIIKTGRTHQIRVHLAAYNHPIVGDNLYSTKATRAKNKQLGLSRLFLTAVKLGFTDLAGQRQVFSCPLPRELQRFLKQVK